MSIRRLAAALILPAAVAITPLAAHAAAIINPYNDNFNTSAIKPQWSKITDTPALTLAQQNSRLEMLASSPASTHDDALYLSNGPGGFALSTAGNFFITLDYSFASYQSAGDSSGDALGVDFGVGTDPTGANSAAIGYGYATFLGQVIQGVTTATRTNDVQTASLPDWSTAPTGTFDIAYDAATDTLMLAAVTNGQTTFTQNFAGLVQGTWNANTLLVSFGGRGNGFSTASGDAWLDNFTILAGQTVPTTPVPEPAAIALLALIAATLPLSRPRRNG